MLVGYFWAKEGWWNSHFILLIGVALKLIWDEYVQPISNKEFYATKLDA